VDLSDATALTGIEISSVRGGHNIVDGIIVVAGIPSPGPHHISTRIYFDDLWFENVLIAVHRQINIHQDANQYISVGHHKYFVTSIVPCGMTVLFLPDDVKRRV